MFLFLAFLGFLGFIIFPMRAIVSLIKKTGKAKRYFIIAGISLVVLLVGAINDDSPEITERVQPEETEEVDKEAAQVVKEEQAEKEVTAAAKEKAAKETHLNDLTAHFIDVGQADHNRDDQTRS